MEQEKSKALKVSIVLVSHNGEKYIGQQIESILNQSYSDLELIICDDASSDLTFKIASNYAKKDARIRIFGSRKNIGTSKNLEKGLKKSHGAYIAISDQDDYWMPTKIEKQAHFMNEHGSTSLVYHDTVVCNENLYVIRESFRTVQRASLLSLHRVDVQNDTLAVLLRENHISGHTIMMRRELLDYIIPIPSTIFPDWWISLVSSTCSKITFMNEVLTKFRQHNSNYYSGATIRGYTYYLFNMFNKGFDEEYVKEKTSYISVLNQLLRRSKGGFHSKLIREKIMCLKVIVKVIKANSIDEFLYNIYSALKTILNSEQRYHLTYLLFFIFYKMNPFKIKV